MTFLLQTRPLRFIAAFTKLKTWHQPPLKENKKLALEVTL